MQAAQGTAKETREAAWAQHATPSVLPRTVELRPWLSASRLLLERGDAHGAEGTGASPHGGGKVKKAAKLGTAVGGQEGRYRVEMRGTFNGTPRPKVVGVSDQVAFATKTMERDAAKALWAWKRTLPKGVRI